MTYFWQGAAEQAQHWVSSSKKMEKVALQQNIRTSTIIRHCTVENVVQFIVYSLIIAVLLVCVPLLSRHMSMF